MGVTELFPNIDGLRIYAMIAGYVNMIASVILLYDYIITLADEVSESRSFYSSNHTALFTYCYRCDWYGRDLLLSQSSFTTSTDTFQLQCRCIAYLLRFFLLRKHSFSGPCLTLMYATFHPTIRIFDLPVAIRCVSFLFLYRFGFMRVIQVSKFNSWIFFCNGE